jgi:hypothetical protein
VAPLGVVEGVAEFGVGGLRGRGDHGVFGLCRLGLVELVDAVLRVVESPQIRAAQLDAVVGTVVSVVGGLVGAGHRRGLLRSVRHVRDAGWWRTEEIPALTGQEKLY